jgi:hypothetical protein
MLGDRAAVASCEKGSMDAMAAQWLYFELCWLTPVRLASAQPLGKTGD